MDAIASRNFGSFSISKACTNVSYCFSTFDVLQVCFGSCVVALKHTFFHRGALSDVLFFKYHVQCHCFVKENPSLHHPCPTLPGNNPFLWPNIPGQNLSFFYCLFFFTLQLHFSSCLSCKILSFHYVILFIIYLFFFLRSQHMHMLVRFFSFINLVL